MQSASIILLCPKPPTRPKYENNQTTNVKISPYETIWSAATILDMVQPKVAIFNPLTPTLRLNVK